MADDGERVLEARRAARDLGRGRPEPQDGAGGDALARRGRGAGRTPARSSSRSSTRAIAKAEREAALAKLQKAQTSIGGFPWWPGGPPSPYMTALHPPRLRQGPGVRRRRARRTWSSGRGPTCTQHYRRRARARDDGPRLLLGVRHLPQLRRSPATPTPPGPAASSPTPSARRCSTSRSSTGSSTRPTSRATSPSPCKRIGPPEGRRARLGLASWTRRRRPRTRAPSGRPRTAPGSGTTTPSRRHAFALRTLMELAPEGRRAATASCSGCS